MLGFLLRMAPIRPFLLLVLLVFLSHLTHGQELIATLSYGTFKGTYNPKYNITYFRKIPFAAPPVGENRFRAPQPPVPITNGTFNSDQAYNYCPQRTVNGSEDCLYLGLYARPWNRTQPLRPVVVSFYGGGFIRGGGSFSIPPPAYPVLNVSSKNDFIYVSPNYRVNAFGFLPGAEIAASNTSDLNPGLLDQQTSLKWVRSYIKEFGGDPEQVTIWGQSAGAGSVVAQVIANGGKTEPSLFKRALMSSPYWPKAYAYNSPQAQAVYDNLANLTGCVGAESLKCLKTVDVQTIRTAALAMADSHTYTISSYTWAPVIDGLFLTQSLSQASFKGEANIDIGWGMYNTHEGENFIPPGLASLNSSTAFNSTTASFNAWIKGFLPELPQDNINQILSLYPPNGSSEDIASYNDTYTRAGLIYRDVVLACPAYWMARAAKSKSYVGEYTISPAKHASDVDWWNSVQTKQTTQPLIYQGFTGAFASFFQTGDPNARTLTGGVPVVEDSGGEEWVVGAEGFSAVRLGGLDRRCGIWRDMGQFVPF